MDDFYYTFGKWTFIGGGSFLVIYLLIKLEEYIKKNKKFKQMDRIEKKFQDKDPTLMDIDLYLLRNSYDWFLENLRKNGTFNKYVEKNIEERYAGHEKWFKGERLKPNPNSIKKMYNGYLWELIEFPDGKKFYRSSLGEYLTIEKFKEELEEERKKQ